MDKNRRVTRSSRASLTPQQSEEESPDFSEDYDEYVSDSEGSYQGSPPEAVCPECSTSTTLTAQKPRTQPNEAGAVGELKTGVPDCAVCLQSCVHPARLPCGHIFCFLCLKGIVHGSRSCAMCRQTIPSDYLDHPDLLEGPSCSESAQEAPAEQYQWFYEGRNGGWWQYEERMVQEFEEMRAAGVSRFETLICGSLYIIDLYSMMQFQKDFPMRKRKILRELPSQVHLKRGVAGIK